MQDWVVVLVVFGMFAFFVGANVLTMRLSGWYALSQAYPCRPSPPEQRRWGVSGKVGSVYYNGGLIVGVDPGGLYVACAPPLNFLARPFYIPWSALHFERRWKFLWTPKLRFRAETGTAIELHGKAARMIESALDVQTL